MRIAAQAYLLGAAVAVLWKMIGIVDLSWPALFALFGAVAALAVVALSLMASITGRRPT